MTVVSLTARRAKVGLPVVLASAAVGAELVRQPSLTRFVAAACFAVCGITAAAQWPRTTSVALLILLPFLALSRRLLLEFAPWTSADPLLLLVPALISLILVGVFVLRGRAIAPDRISRLVLWLSLLMLLEALNPRGGGISAGAAALLFTVVPLLWFFLGRELATRRAMLAVFVTAVPIACLVAVYGLTQTWSGFPSWDQMWIQEAGYAALNVGGVIRAFGTFASSAEYGSYLSVAFVAAFAFAVSRRPYFLPAIPLLGVAIFYESERGIIVFTVISTLVVFAARSGSMRRASVTLAASLAAIVVAVFSAHAWFQQTAATSSDPLVTHLLGGLAHPLNSSQSTLPGHLTLLESGFRSGVVNPFGQGIASTTLAGSKFGGSSASTELDLSNVFVSCGTFGGLAYLAIVFLVLRLALRRAVARRDSVSLASLGVLVTTFGSWLNGGFYAVSPLVWFTAGFLVAEEALS